jgi:hypothetical protein
MGELRSALSAPVDAASLGIVRMALGAIGLLTAVRIVAYGWIDSLYAGPVHRFTYLGFGWVPQPSAGVAAVLVGTLALASVAVGVGWHTRGSVLALLVSFAWIELIDVTTYLNHYWFVTLLATLCLFAPVGRSLALDARRDGPGTVARGWVWLVRFQVGVVYSFAGLAKLNADWLDGLPLRLWLPARSHGTLAFLAPLLQEPSTAQALAIAGAAFDCSIVGLLLFRRTRLPAWIALVAFHVTTWLLFPIGVFPWLMIAVSTVFFPPPWPRDLWSRLRRVQQPQVAMEAEAELVERTALVAAGGSRWRQRVLAVGVAGWVVVQLVLPLRHLAYPGDYRWTGQGYRFAWNVLLTEKSGSVTFEVTEPSTGRTWIAEPELLYTENQLRVMTSEPDLIHQAARTIAAEERQRGHDVEVRVDAWLSLNGRPARRLIDPTVDLAAEPRDIGDDDWILTSGEQRRVRCRRRGVGGS